MQNFIFPESSRSVTRVTHLVHPTGHTARTAHPGCARVRSCVSVWISESCNWSSG